MTNELPKRGGRPGASVKITQNEPRDAISRHRSFAARNSDRFDESIDSVENADGAGAVRHSRPGTVVMYKPTERAGFIPRRVSVSAIDVLFRQGWQDVCPDCKGHHLDRYGNPSTDPNACSARDPVGVRVCPVCRKRVFDNMAMTGAMMAEDEDPNVIVDDAYASSDPAMRTKQKLDLHLWIRHPEWAQANGVPPLPSAFREMVDGAPRQAGT